jgi:hypothetical protein
MPRSKLYLFLPMLFASLLISTCDFGQYNDRASLKIVAKFPHKATGTNSASVSKPYGEGLDYVPFFVCGIRLTLTKDGETTEIWHERDEAGNLSNNFDDLTELEYGAYKLNINVYSEIFSPVMGGECGDSDSTITHSYSDENFEIGSDLLGAGLKTANLETNSGQEVILGSDYGTSTQTLTVSGNPPTANYAPYILENGDFGFYWLEDNDILELGCTFVDKKCAAFEGVSMIRKQSNPNYNLAIIGEKIFYPYVSDTQNQLFLSPDFEATHTGPNPFYTTPESSTIANPYIDMTGHLAVVAWEEGGGIKAMPFTYDPETGVYDKNLCSTPYELTASPSLIMPKVKIIDDESFLLVGLREDVSYLTPIAVKVTKGCKEIDASKPLNIEIGENLVSKYSPILGSTSAFSFLYQPRIISVPYNGLSITDFDMDLSVKNSFAIDDANNDYEHIFGTNLPNGDPIAVFAVQPEGLHYGISYYLDPKDSFSPADMHLVASDNNLDFGSPKIAVNPDGLSVISWLGSNGTINFKLYLF